MILDKNKIGLISGLFLAGLHALWALLVLIVPNGLQWFLDWIFEMHFLQPIWKLTAFNALNALMLVVVTFVFGFAAGWLFSWIHNLFHKMK